MPNPSHFNSAKQGQSLNEYCLIGALVAIVCIVGILALGKDLKGTLTGLQSDVQTNVSAADAASTHDFSARTGLPTGRNCYSSDLCLNWGQGYPVPQQSSSSSQTSGSLGTTDMQQQYAQGIAAQLISQLGSDPKYSELVDILTRLSLSGHEVADKQEQLAKKCPTGGKCMEEKMETATANFDQLSNELETYLSAHPDILSSDLQQQLLTVTGTIQTDASTFDPYADTAKETADKTHKNSNEVCSSGGDETQCIQ